MGDRHLAARVEHLTGRAADDEVEVALRSQSRSATHLSVLHLGILDLVPLARHVPQTGRQKRDLLGEDAQFSHVGSRRNAADADYVSRAEFLVQSLKCGHLLRITLLLLSHSFRRHIPTIVHVEGRHDLQHGFSRANVVKVELRPGTALVDDSPCDVTPPP